MRFSNYEQLSPAESRFSRLRAPRRRAGELFPSIACQFYVDGQLRALYDLSSTGAKYFGDSEPRPKGMEVRLRFALPSDVIVDLVGEIVRTESKDGQPTGVRFVGSHVDLEALARGHDQALMRDRILAIPPTRQAVSPRYREAIDELTHFLLWHKVTLNEGLDDLADEATLQSVVNAVSPRFRELCSMAESALGEFAPSSEQLAAIRQFTHTNVTTLLADAPVVQRGYSKPFGYPGDYELMSMIYEPTFDGSTPFGRVFHRVFLDDPLAIGGRARCAYMQSILQREYRLWGQRSDDRFRVASLGCGPALELAHWLQDVSLPAKVDVTLVDQERAALRTAQQACFSAASRGVDLRVACHTLSFVEMLRDLGSLVERGRPHLVYVTGLFDYLKEPVAQRLAASLVRAVGPGGAVVIANAKAPCIGTWCCEFVLDWSLIYRTRSEMEALAQLCGPRVQTTVESGDNSAFHFLVLRTS